MNLLEKQLVSQNLQSLLAGEQTNLTIEQIKNTLEHRSIIIVLFLFALPCILPIPFISSFAGIILIICSTQLIYGNDSLWLPEVLSQKSISYNMLYKLISKAMPYIVTIEKLCQTKLAFNKLGQQIFYEKLVGIVSLIFSIYITLPVIFGNSLPSIGICLMALGLINKNMLLIMAGILIGLVGVIMASLVILTGINLLSLVYKYSLTIL